MNKLIFKNIKFPLFSIIYFLFYVFTLSSTSFADSINSSNKQIAYIVSDTRIPFWEIMSRGIESTSKSLGYSLKIYSADNSAKKELEATIKAIKDKVSGIIVSPTTSSACVSILKFAKKAKIPVIIADIGTDSGEYASYISSDNYRGAYQIGKILVDKLVSLDWHNGRVGIIAIPQVRLNGQARTAGFMKAMSEANILGAGIEQQVVFSEKETYDLSTRIIDRTPNLRALWLQGSNRYQGALQAIKDAGKTNEILLITFDAEPEFLDLIPKGILVGSAMQQPYLIGEKAVQTLHDYLNGNKVIKNQKLPILAISTENIESKLNLIKRNTLGIIDNNTKLK